MCGAKQKGARKSPQVRILELGCMRPGEISRNFCVNVRGSKCKSKSYVARDENTRTWLSRRLRVE